MTIPLRPAIYVRVSNKTQKSREAQIDECKLWMARNGWPFNPDLVYSEAETSHKGDARAQYARCREDLKRGHVDALVLWSVHRWGRTVWQLIRDMDWCVKDGIPFVGINENLRLTGESRASEVAHAHLIAVFAQYQRSQLSELISMGKRKSYREGKNKGGRPRTVPEPAVIYNFLEAGHTWRQCREKYDISDAAIGRAKRAHLKSLKRPGRPAQPPLDSTTEEL